jgi:hypothetical protein
MHYFRVLPELWVVAIFVGWQKIEMVQGQQYFVRATIYPEQCAFSISHL